jgi:hypothetical protein
MNTKAVYRLHATLNDDEATPVEAQFDAERDSELIVIRDHLSNKRLIFKLSRNHLFHKSNLHEIEDESQRIVRTLLDLGFNLKVLPGVLKRPRFALKGTQGLVLQRIQTDLRIFFSK